MLNANNMLPITTLTLELFFAWSNCLTLKRKMSRNRVESELDQGNVEGRNNGGPRFQIRLIRRDFENSNLCLIKININNPVNASIKALNILKVSRLSPKRFNQDP
jgi:hypothetical protein